MEETTGWVGGWTDGRINSMQEGTKMVPPKDGLEVTGAQQRSTLEYQLDNLQQRTKGRQNLEIVEKMAWNLGDIGRG